MPFCANSSFWHPELTFNSSWPLVTQCFRSTVLVYIPSAFLWVACIFYLPYLCGREVQRPPPKSWMAVCKTGLSVLLAMGSIVLVICDVTEPLGEPMATNQQQQLFGPPDPAHYFGLGFTTFNYILTAVLPQLERQRKVFSSGVLFVFWLLVFVTGLVSLYTYLLSGRYTSAPVIFAVQLLSQIVFVLQLALNSFSDRQLLTLSRYSTRKECPEVTASFPSKITFAWITKLIIAGHRQRLTADDMWTLNSRDTTTRALDRLVNAWKKCNIWIRKGCHSWVSDSSSTSSPAPNKSSFNTLTDVSHLETDSETAPLLASDWKSQEEIPKSYAQKEEEDSMSSARRRSKCSLSRVLLRAFGWEVCVAFLCKAVSDCLQFVSPFLLKALILYIEDQDRPPTWYGFGIASAMLIASWVQTLFYHQHYHLAMTAGMRMKAALMAAIYRKSLCLDVSHQISSEETATEGQDLRAGTTGEIINLMAVDCQRIQEMMSYVWMIWSLPLQIFLAVYLLWTTLGPPVLSGLFLLFLLVPLNAFIAYKQHKLNKKNLGWKDKRVSLIGEILSGIKVLKLYAWEESFQQKVLALRRRETAVFVKLAWLNAFGIFISTCIPYLVCFASFTTYVVAYRGSVLTADMAFVCVSLFNILQFPIAFIPEMVAYMSQASVSMRRIGNYFCERELDKINRSDEDSEYAVYISKGHFSWDSRNKENFSLRDIELKIPKGQLVAVVGPVGSGKTSLLAAILGEMSRLQGHSRLSGSVAYVPQSAWIQNATVRDNILFGSSFSKRKYNKVVDACALKEDFRILPGEDWTEIGEKGINLSGGQKQRVSIARAVYADCDVYILDDVLSAVDSHVGKHIFKKVLSNKGLLRNKTRILATHSIHLLPLVDTIVVMKEGRISEMGSYMDLMREDGEFSQFLLHHLSKEAETSDSEVDDDPEVRAMKMKILEDVGNVTGQSDGTTSGDEFRERFASHWSGSSSLSNLNRHENRVHDTCKVTTAPKTRDIAQLTQDEESKSGAISFGVFGSYFRAIGPFCTIIILLLFALYQVSSIWANVWLSEWTGDPAFQDANFTKQEISEQNFMYLKVYGILGAFQAFFVLIYACIAALRMVSASSSMHAAMLDCVMRCPMSFFDTTPIGRIVNRFSADMETPDNKLPQIVFMFIMCVFSVVATLIVISYNTPIFTSVILPLFVAYWAIQRFFIPTSRQMKRLEAVTRSPIFSHFSETLTGCHVIRAFRVVSRFVQTSVEKIDLNQVFYFAGITANRWLGVWIEILSSLIVFFSALFSLLTPGVNGAMLGLSVSYALQITQCLKWLVRTMSDIETNCVSLERILEYTQLPSEPARHTGIKPPVDWPDRGEVIMQNYSGRYRTGLEPVLQNLNCVIEPGEKIGIVGRTGAGKSSLTLALFRMLETVSGHVFIDNVNIADLGLHDLRSRITVLPQDPVILSGCLRINVDPNHQHSDTEIWTALELSHLKDLVSAMPGGLDGHVGEGGANLSAGQRQLLCLTRALLRRTKILVLDEPTSSVDMHTDTLVQETVRRAFSDCTTFTIAHRLNTVLECDRVIVMDKGRIVEFDSPKLLMKDPSSRFYSLAKSSGMIWSHSNVFVTGNLSNQGN